MSSTYTPTKEEIERAKKMLLDKLKEEYDEDGFNANDPYAELAKQAQKKL